MPEGRATRVLVVTDHAEPTPALLEALRRRGQGGEVQFRLVVLNPARAEVHLLHPERHDKAAEAEVTLYRALPRIKEVTGCRVNGSVSVRHDPMDAIESTLADEPIDEIMLALPEHHLSTWLHQDLAHRLKHWGLPVQTVPAGPGQAPG